MCSSALAALVLQVRLCVTTVFREGYALLLFLGRNFGPSDGSGSLVHMRFVANVGVCFDFRNVPPCANARP